MFRRSADHSPRRARCLRNVAVATLAIVSGSCAPEIGTERWCQQFAGTPKAEWTSDDIRGFVGYCVVGASE